MTQLKTSFKLWILLGGVFILSTGTNAWGRESFQGIPLDRGRASMGKTPSVLPLKEKAPEEKVTSSQVWSHRLRTMGMGAWALQGVATGLVLLPGVLSRWKYSLEWTACGLALSKYAFFAGVKKLKGKNNLFSWHTAKEAVLPLSLDFLNLLVLLNWAGGEEDKRELRLLKEICEGQSRTCRQIN